MFRKIRWRIAFPYILLILVSMAGLSLYISKTMETSTLNDLEANMAVEARMVAEVVQNDWPEPAALDSAAKHWADVLGARVTLIAANGEVLGESGEDRQEMDNHSNRSEVITALATGQGSSVRFSHTLGVDMLYTAVRLGEAPAPLGEAPMLPGEAPVLPGVVRLARPLSQVQQSLARMRGILLTFSLLAAVLAGLLAIWIASFTSRPVEQLTRAAEQMASGKLEVPPVTNTMDEVGQLIRAFNHMALKIQQQVNDIQEERGKLAAVLDHMNDAILILDGDGSIRLLNPAAATMFGINIQNAAGRSLPEVLRIHQPYEIWQQSQKTQEIQQIRLEYRKQLVLNVSAIPLGQSLPGHTLLLFQDITRQNQVEAMRRDFISNVSHELRTPLTALKALTETLRDGALDDPPAAQRFLERMETEVDALNLMVMELLELSRIESGRVPLNLQPTRPLEIIQAAQERLSLQAERADLHLALECPPDLPSVQADAVRIQQVLVNLLHNAIKFTPAGGRITMGAAAQGHTVVFHVRDTGIGIAAKDIPRIFERFYKIDRARSGGGTGLGLAIARHMVEAHGGKIWVESQPDQGSTFYFTLLKVSESHET